MANQVIVTNTGNVQVALTPSPNVQVQISRAAIGTVSNVPTANFANYAGNVTVANQPNITSVGTLGNLNVSNTITTLNLSVTGNLSAGNLIANNANYANFANVANTANSVAVGNVVGIGNIATINLDGSSSNVLFGNGVFAPESTSIANANYANFAGEAFSVSGSNVNGAVNLANFATTANAVAGANVSGIVANANFASYSEQANNANLATFATTANAVAGANVSGIVANANFASYSEQANNANLANFATTANAVAGANVSGTVANANFASYSEQANNANLATFATTANAVAGANVSGVVANANFASYSEQANNANLATYATTANAVAGANVSGYVANATHSNIADVANSVSGSNVSGQVANALVAGTVYTNAQPNITSLGNLTSLTVSGDGLIAGNLTVGGNISYVNVNNLVVQDPVIELGGGPNGAPLTTNDGKDRGTLLHYYTTQPIDAFMGWDNGNGEFAFGSNVTNNVDVMTFNTLGNVRAQTFIGNLTGLASSATVAASANAVAGANVSGAVAYATTANSVAVGNVSGIGNIATVNLDGNASNILFGNGTFSAIPVVSNVANANYANFAGTAYSVSGANVSGEVANANFASYANLASTANLATFATTANSVAGANVSGEVANANYASYANVAASANSVAVGNVSGIGNIATINLDGSSSNVLFGNGVFAPESTSIANANYANFAGQVVDATQSNITSLGTLTGLSVTGNANINGTLTLSLNSGFLPKITALSDSVNANSRILAITSGSINSANIANGNTAGNLIFNAGGAFAFTDPGSRWNAIGGITQITSGPGLTANGSANGGDVSLNAGTGYSNLYAATGGIVSLTGGFGRAANGDSTGGTVTFTSGRAQSITTGTSTSGNLNLVIGSVSGPSGNVRGNINIGSLAANGTTTFPGNINIGQANTPTNIGGDANIAGNLTVVGNITANFFNGNGSLLTGIVATSANFANFAGNVTVSSQPNITSVANSFSSGQLTLNTTGAGVPQLSLNGTAGSSNAQLFINQGSLVVTNTDLSGGASPFAFNIYGNSAYQEPQNYIRFRGVPGTPLDCVAGDTILNQRWQAWANGGIEGVFNVGAQYQGYTVGQGAYGQYQFAAAGDTANTSFNFTAGNISFFGTSIFGGNANVTGNLTSGNANLGNLAVANFFSGDGSLLSNINGSNVSSVANANYANIASTANLATFATTANAVAGANVSGVVANANYSAYANIAASANSVAVANVSGIGNIATINLDGNVSNLLTGNGTFVAIPTVSANANYANFAGQVVDATQSNITQVGTLVSLAVTGNVSANALQLTTSPGTLSPVTGQMVWDTASNTVSLGMLNGVTQQIGLESYVLVKASATITDGQVVMFTGANGNHVTAAPADTTSVGFRAEYVIGVATQSIATNDFGYITVLGIVHGLNTNAFNVGDILWVDNATPGGLTATRPTDPNFQIEVAAVTKKSAGDGHLQVRVTAFNNIDSLTDVTITTPTAGQALVYNGSNVWVNGNPNIANIAYSVAGANVSGQVANSLIAGTVYTNAQPNITSVGTLTSLTVSGNLVPTNLVLASFNETVVAGGNTSTSISPNVANGTIFNYTANANFTFNSLTSVVAGTSATVIITQDATGNRLLTSTMLFAGASKTLSTAASAKDIISVFYDGTNYFATLSKGYA